MTAIPIEHIGRIANASGAGQFVMVRDDQERTGGFLIFRSPTPDIFSAPEVFACWVERRADVDAFFSEAGWTVEWQPQLAPR